MQERLQLKSKNLGLLTSLEKKSGSLSIISHRNLYLLGLALILCGLLWANFLMSLGQLVLLGNWLLEANFKAKYAKLSENKNVIIVLLLFLIHLLGCAWTIDFDYAMKDIVNKLPLLVLPILIASTEKLSKKEWKFLLGIYFSTSLIISLISLGKLLGFVGNEIVDKRELSVLISHIRYGLNLAFAVILIFYFSNLFKKRIRYALYFLAAWFILALFKFELSTGLTILIILSFSIAFLLSLIHI